MKPEVMKYISVKERTHYMRCPDCGGYFDMRDVQQVSDHFHKSAALKAECSGPEVIGGPKYYTKRKRRSGLN